MKICSICHKISGTDEDHLDCKEKKRIELENQDLKQKIPEKLDMAKNANDLNVDIKSYFRSYDKRKKEKIIFLSFLSSWSYQYFIDINVIWSFYSK